MEIYNTIVYKVSVDSKEIAKVPFGGLESFIACVLKSSDSVNISLLDLVDCESFISVNNEK